MAFVPFSRKTARTAAEPVFQPGSPPVGGNDEGSALHRLGETPLGDLQEGAYSENNIQQVLDHNVSLRRNFDNLKQLHLQLTESNMQLQEACLRLQEEKEALEKATIETGDFKREKEMLRTDMEELRKSQDKEIRLVKCERVEAAANAGEMELRIRSLEKKVSSYKTENKELLHKIEVMRMEKEQAMVGRHCAELEYSRELSALKVEDNSCRQQAGDLAHKCKHLELDLEKAIGAGEAVHQQLLAVTYEKDAVIVDLERALRRLEEEMYAVQEPAKRQKRIGNLNKKKFKPALKAMTVPFLSTARSYILQSLQPQGQYCEKAYGDRQNKQMERMKEETGCRIREELELRIRQLQREKDESEHRCKEESELRMKEVFMEMRFEEEQQRELRRTLEGEAADLRAMLAAMEQASTDAELRHTECTKVLTKECEALRNELGDVKSRYIDATNTLAVSLKENAELVTEIDGLHAQLNDILTKNHEAFSQIAEYRKTQDEYEKQVQHLKAEVRELKTLHEREHLDDTRRLEDAKRNWEAEKEAIMRRVAKVAEVQRRELCHKNHSLKKKLKDDAKLLASMTIDHNHLLLRQREIEAQLSLAQTTTMVHVSTPTGLLTPRFTRVFGRNNTNTAWLKAEMAQLKKRQSHYPPFQVDRGEERLNIPQLEQQQSHHPPYQRDESDISEEKLKGTRFEKRQSQYLPRQRDMPEKVDGEERKGEEIIGSVTTT